MKEIELDENLTKLDFKPNIIIADSMDSLVHFLKTKRGEYRIILDKKRGISIICPSNECIHVDSMVYAVDEGWYADYINGNDWDNIDEYFGKGIEEGYIELLIFSDKNNYEDYDSIYWVNEYPFGYIFTKGEQNLPKELKDLIGEPIKTNHVIYESLNRNREVSMITQEEIKEAVAELNKEETLPELNDNFWRWFGDSVVKDEDGNPLICFHGSTLDIDEFDTEYSGNNTGNNEEKVFYFTTDREMAVSYSTEAVIRQKELPYYNKEEGTEYETWEEFEDYLRTEVCKTPHINPCFICMEKPYIYDAGFRDFDPKLNYTLMSMIKGEIDTSHWLFDENLYYDIANEHEEYDEETDEYIQIKDFDYDGIIIRNVRDSISPLVDKYCDEYIVWSPTQIKSIYNKGNWSWNSRNVFETLNRELKRYL